MHTTIATVFRLGIAYGLPGYVLIGALVFAALPETSVCMHLS